MAANQIRDNWNNSVMNFMITFKLYVKLGPNRYDQFRARACSRMESLMAVPG